jgi:hypothetical protein
MDKAMLLITNGMPKEYSFLKALQQKGWIAVVTI